MSLSVPVVWCGYGEGSHPRVSMEDPKGDKSCYICSLLEGLRKDLVGMKTVLALLEEGKVLQAAKTLEACITQNESSGIPGRIEECPQE